MRAIRTNALFVLIGILTAASASAQYWPKPAPTPGVDVRCTGCLESHNGKLTPGYPSTITGFTGRFLDSQATQDYQQPFRTARAFHVRVAPDRNRIYMIVGSALFAYNIDTFFTRLAAGEALMGANAMPTHSQYPQHGPPYELFLRYDSFFYAENEPTGWQIFPSDGQERLFDVDYDDQGYVYLAYFIYGWGIVKDDGGNGGALLQSASQVTDVLPNFVTALKGSDGRYYAATGLGDVAKSIIYDVTDRTHPVQLRTIPRALLPNARTSDWKKIAIVSTDNKFQIYTSDGFLSNGAPIAQFDAPAGALIRGAATDGTNFYSASDGPSGLVISTYAPSGSSYVKVGDVNGPSGLSSTYKLQYGDGWLVCSGSTNARPNLNVFKLQNGVPQLLNTNDGFNSSYFQRYYTIDQSTQYTHPNFAFFYDSTIIKRNGKNYLLALGYSLGDVYELPSGDSITVVNQGVRGTANLNAPAGSSTGPFYGDPIAFMANTSANAAVNVLWDFGNTESGTDNTAAGVTGSPVSHRFSGLTSPSQLPTTRTVKATNATDSSISGAVAVTLQQPAPRFAINPKYIFTQADASSQAPIVYGDKFFDISDGTIESHYATWAFDQGAPVKTLPYPGPVDVGTCGTHTLNFDAHYGPYVSSPAIASTGADMAVGIHGFTYNVRPFAAGIEIGQTSDGLGLQFTAVPRFSLSNDGITQPQIAQLSYKWELLNAQNSILLLGPTGGVPLNGPMQWTMAKSWLNTPGGPYRAHLVMTSPNGVGPACAGKNTSESFTAPLSGPDPTIVNDCSVSPCNFSAGSASGIDQTADNWSYSWSVSLPSGGSPAAGVVTPATGTARTFTPSFTSVGSYVISLTVTNTFGVKTVTRNINITQASGNCATMSSNDITMGFSGSRSSCSPGFGTCSAGETINFSVTSFFYDFSCNPNTTFSWTFGDGTTGAGRTVNHAYSNNGSYSAVVTINNGTQTNFQLTQTVPVGTGSTPPPPPPPPPPSPTPSPTGCAALTASQITMGYSGSRSTCTPVFGTCQAGELLSFSVTSFYYDFGCGPHTFAWNFGDGGSASGQNPTHTYATNGGYTATVTISNGVSTLQLSQPVNVGGSSTPTPPPPTPTPPTPTPTPGTGSCGPLVPQQNVFIDYRGQNSGCTEFSGDCFQNESLTISALPFTYDFNCAAHTFAWTFGDGATGSGRTTTHQYANAGTYPLTLIITVNGVQTQLSQTVKVAAGVGVQPPPPTADFPFDFTVQSLPGVPNGYIFTASVKAGSTATTNTYNWTFGDGSSASGSATQPHIYADGNVYTITLSVPGYTGSAQHSVGASRHRPSHH